MAEILNVNSSANSSENPNPNSTPNAKPELLAPAGNIAALKAAAKGGADAVYVGLQRFSARGNADNFQIQELRNLKSETSLKIYVALNTVIFDNELKEFENTVEKLAEIGVDGVIVQDLGTLHIAKKHGLKLHASTQMTVHSVHGCEFLKSHGFDRVVLARELPYETLKKISEHCRKIGLETEIFVHGAQCFAVSGQCYMSAMFGGLSANRGYCASACRLPFKANSVKTSPVGTHTLPTDFATKNGEKKGYANSAANFATNHGEKKGYAKDSTKGSAKSIANSHCLSLRDLCLINHVNSLKDIGITSLKIEGRMKSPEYVLETTKSFRNALDDREFDMKKLQQVSVQRGFSDSYFVGKSHDFGKNSAIGNSHAIGNSSGNLKPKYPSNNVLNSLAIPFRLRLRKLSDLGNLNPQFNSSSQKLNPQFIILPLSECEKVDKLNQQFNLNSQNLNPEFIIIEPPRVDFEPENTVRRLKMLKSKGFSRLLINNVAYIQIASELGFKLHGDFGLNVANSNAAEFLAMQNFEDVTLSFELRKEKINAISDNLSRNSALVTHKKPLKIGIIAYGTLPLMLSKTCPIGDCKNCMHKIVDRKNKSFFVACNGGYRSDKSGYKGDKCSNTGNNGGYVEIYNSDNLDILDRLSEFNADFVTILPNYVNSSAKTNGLYFRSVK